MAKGKFIVFEGIECCGKSTQIFLLSKVLAARQENVVLTEEQWEEDAIGRLIKEELKEKEDNISVATLQFLFIANRSDHVEKIIAPKLDSGNTVICDRYWMSTVVYGDAFSGQKGLDRDYFIRINSIFQKPDVVFYIDIDPSDAYKRAVENKRIKKGNEIEPERFDKLETLKKLRKGYLELGEVYDGLWINIDGNKDKEAVGKEILEQYERLFTDK